MAGSLSSVSVANFVTVKLGEGDDIIRNFKIWKKQMLCLLESQDVVGFVDGGILQPPPLEKGGGDSSDEQKQWRRTDRLVQGWILGSLEKEVLDAVWEKQTAREVWVELDNIFKVAEEVVEKEKQREREREKEEREREREKEERERERERENVSRYLALHQAAQRGDWETAEGIFQDVTQLSTTIISVQLETALHVAVLSGKANDFVKKLVDLTPPELLEVKNIFGQTALHNAAIVGNTEAAIALVRKNPGLLHISHNFDNQLAVTYAAVGFHKETLEYLISEHEKPNNPPLFEGQPGIFLLNAIIASGFIDIALCLAYKYPNLAILTKDDTYESGLSTIAGMPTLFQRTETFTWYQNFIYHCIPIKKSKYEDAHTTSFVGGRDIENFSDNAAHNTLFRIISGVGKKVESTIWNLIQHLVPKVKEMREKKTTHEQTLQLAEFLCHKMVSLLSNKAAINMFHKTILRAAEKGISEIVEMIIHNYPDATLSRDSEDRSVFMVAASNRFENVINLFYNMSDVKYIFLDYTDNQDNNMMHICGKLAPPRRLNLVAGAALQMQRELQWFKEMENFVNPSRRYWNNKEIKTPQMIFTEEHAQLKADGERWMKDTANACTIAAALIATVVFAAAFTVPGGIKSETGMPLLSGKPAFLLFAISDAVSLFTSITSLLMFLSILTSRYAEEDFLYVLPKRLSMGLLSLFVSITFMLVAFSSTFYLVFQGDGAWFLALVAAFTCLPVASFVLLQFPLLLDVLYSTYGPGIFRH